LVPDGVDPVRSKSTRRLDGATPTSDRLMARL